MTPPTHTLSLATSSTTRSPGDPAPLLFFLLLIPASLKAWPRLGEGASPVFQSSGDKGVPFTVNVNTTTATRVYTQNTNDREIMFQNTNSSYYVYCGSHSAVVASSGPRFFIPPKPSSVSTNAAFSLYCIVESGFGSGNLELIGIAERDLRDAAQ